MNSFKTRLIFLAVAMGSLAGCSVKITQDSFFPRSGIAAPAGELIAPDGYTMSQAFLEVGDLGVVNTVFLDNPQSNTTIIYHGGNGSFVSRQTRTAAALADATQADLIFYDYPGRGGTTVAATVDSSISVGGPMIAALKAKGWIGNGATFNYGLSFGGSQAAAMARNGGFAGLIIEGSAADFAAIGRDFVPGIARPFVKVEVSPDLYAFDYLGFTKAAGTPVLLISGEKDSVIRPKRMREFANALKASGVTTTFVSVPGGHGAALAGSPGREALAAFVKAHSS